ncbi:unnamed protein product [Blepharisma stoltei]|uniref:Uncharacterized protein n=1 Tax=Blepharisma stoltei TaxID=1481888 RepID=A0AAU9IK67_9CILI|nr:unnamed protein product [Blepharisma stoltei]
MECPICSELFNEGDNCPRLLRCGHTCCELCLNQVIDENQITCPTCRSISVTAGTSSLPKNYTVLEFIANTKSAELVNWAKSKLPSQCQEHPEENVIRYCIEDSKPVCAECILLHNGHKLVKLDDPVLERRYEVKGLIGKVEEMLDTAQKKEIEIENRREQLTQSTEKELGRIDGYFARIYDKLEQKKQFLKEKIEEESQTCGVRLQSDLDEISQFVIQVQQYLENLNTLNTKIESMSPLELTNSNWSHTITSSKREVHLLLSQCQKISMIDSTSVISSRALFNPKPLEQEINKFGMISAGVDFNNPAIYCFGTQNTVLKFNLATQRWSQTVILETNGYDFKNFASAAALPNGSILITGGTKSNEVYEFKENRMIKRNSMLHVRSSHNAVYFNGFVYCIGGYNGSSWHDKCEKISIETFDTLPIASLNYRRCAFSSTISGNDIYVFGGYDGTKYLDNIERYSVIKNKWETLPCVLHRPLQNTGAAYYSDNKIMIAGGYNEKGTLNVVRSLDLETLEWTTLASMAHTRYLMNKFHFCSGCVFAIGGSAQGQNIEYYSIAEGKWTSTKPYKDFTEDTMYKWAAVITQDSEVPRGP